MPTYQSPFQLSHHITAPVVDIATQLGACKVVNRGALLPELRRGNRISNPQPSTAIQQNAKLGTHVEDHRHQLYRGVGGTRLIKTEEGCLK